MYTVFKSKWQIVNLCSCKTTSPKTFKFSMNIGNNWSFCHAKTQILILNSLGVIKHWKAFNFLEKINLSQLYLEESFFSWLSKLDSRVSLTRRVTNHEYKFCLKILLFYCIHEDLNDFQMIESQDFSNDYQKPMIT